MVKFLKEKAKSEQPIRQEEMEIRKKEQEAMEKQQELQIELLCMQSEQQIQISQALMAMIQNKYILICIYLIIKFEIIYYISKQPLHTHPHSHSHFHRTHYRMHYTVPSLELGYPAEMGLGGVLEVDRRDHQIHSWVGHWGKIYIFLAPGEG